MILFSNLWWWFHLVVLFICLFCTADGHSIYIRGLPSNATPALLEDEFKKFGPIKSGGVQVRSNKVWLTLCSCLFLWNFLALIILILIIWQQGFCFGFVEFEVASAVQSAMEVCLSFLLQKLFSCPTSCLFNGYLSSSFV